MRTAILLALLCMLFPVAAITAEESFRPAHFGYEEEDRRLLNRIRFPEIKGDVTVMLICFSQLQPSGKMESTGCMMQNEFDTPFAAAVSEAGKKARMAPAEIDGETVKVYVQFRVQFEAKGEERAVRVILNTGYQENVDAYGEEHVAAQRVIGGKEPWQDICPQRARFAVLAKAYVGEDGRPDSPSVEHAAGVMPTARCQEAIMDSILASRYVPAMVDGVPVPSTFVEMFSN